MKFKKVILWVLMLIMILNLPASTLAATSPVACRTHTWGEWDVIEYPTCTQTGRQIRYCTVCFTQQSGTIPKLPHNWNEWTVTKQPTCTSTGSRFHVCSTCGTRETETMDKAPHKYGKWVDIVPATCSSKGSHYRVCEICGYQQTLDSNPLPHTWSEWVTTKAANCTERGEESRTCSVCGTTETRTTKVNGTVHEWGEWIVRTVPDCEKGGYRSHGCTKCNKWESEKMPPLGHDWGEWTILTPATLNALGLREHKCTRCGKTEKENYAYTGEPGLHLSCQGITPLEAQDGYDYVYEADMVLENTGALPLEFFLDSYNNNGSEVLSDDFVGWNGETGTLNPGETFHFRYQTRTSGEAPEWANNEILRYVYAGGRSPETGMRASAISPLLLRKPQKNGLMLNLVNVHRSGEGKDEVITFDLTVTNLTTAWSLIDLSASSEHGELPGEEGFIGLPEEGLLVHNQESAAFSYRAVAGQADIDASTGMPYIDVSRWISAKDSFGNTADIQIAAKIDVQETADAHLEGSMDLQGRDHVCAQNPVSFPTVLTLRNTGKTEITNPVVKGTLVSNSGKVLRSWTLTPVSGISSLKPQESASFEMTLDITAEDETAAIDIQDQAGSYGLRVLCWAEYGYTAADGPAFGESNLWKQIIPVWELTADDPRNTYILPVLTASYEDRVYQPGETVTFDLTVTNINPTDTISGIRFEWYPYLNNGDTAETPVEVAMPDLKLLPGESYTLEHAFSYTVTTSDAKRGFTVMEFIAWCHSTTFDWWSNCGWHGLVRTEPDSKKGLSLKVTLSPSSIYYIGKAEWKPVNSADSETTNFMGLESATYSGETTVSDAAVKNGDEWIQYPGPDNPAPAIPACITITNQTDAPVTATITSDHPGDIIDWNLPVPPTVPSNGSVTVDYWIYPEPEEIDTGRLERYITAAIPEFPEPLDEYISIHFNPENGIALPAESGPGISLVCTGVTPVWNEEEQKNWYEAYMKVTNTGNMPLSLDAWFVDSHNSVTKDTLAMWDESDKKAFFAPNDELEFVYIIHEQNRDKDEESIRRTLHITGYAYDTGETVMDSTSFVFPCSHTDLLDLALTGYQRLTDPDQTIIANLRLTNRGEETLTGIKFDIRDVNGNIVPEDQFIGVSKEASYSLVPGEYMEFRAKIHPTEDDFEETDVVRTISAVDASASVEDEVYLRLGLKTDKVDNAILYLEGELTGPESLGLGEEFGAHLTAWNYGNMDLEDVTVECTIQSPSGNVLFKKNYVAASSLFAPGQSCNTWPIIAITEQMVINALANVPLKDNEPNTLTFIFSAHGILRSVYSASPICSNQVTFTIHIEHESGIDVSIDSDIPKQSPKAGEPLNIPLIIQNVGRDDLRGLRLEVSKLVGDTYIFMDTLMNNPYEVIHPGDTRSYVFPYVVGNDDAEKGNIGFSFKAIASSSVFDEAMKDTCEYSTNLTPQPVRDLLLTKTVTNTPPEGQAAYRLSDEVHYTITATNNTGVDLYDVEIYDDVDGYSTMFLLDRINLAAGESVDIPFIRVVCPYDVDQKQILNTARAYYMIDPPFELSAESNTVRTPVEDVLDVEQGVFIRKARANNSLDPKGYALNEQIDYDITVFNSSDTDVEVDIWDYVWSTEAPELVAQVTLAPNEIQSFSHFYKVREVDLPPTPDVTGLVTNEAFAGVRVYDGQGNILTGYTVWSLPVEAKTIRTANPEKKDPPVTEKPTVTAKPQTGGGESCRRILTGYGSVGDEYDLLFCTKHSMLETVTRKLSAAEAVSVWTDAVNSSYEALAEKVSTETAAFVQIDQHLFTQQLEAYQTMLADAFGEEKAAEVILQHLRERCNDLCYALHHAPDARPDSILRTEVPVLSAQGEGASRCGRTIEPIPGGYHVTETVCKTHAFITSGLNIRLSGASIEEKASRFDETRQLWMSLLMKKANELYAGQSQEGKASTSASLNLFQGWLNARRNVLLALYPHDPSVAAELLSNTVHTRMLDLDVLMP